MPHTPRKPHAFLPTMSREVSPRWTGDDGPGGVRLKPTPLPVGVARERDFHTWGRVADRICVREWCPVAIEKTPSAR
jgi:hypothetical protein